MSWRGLWSDLRDFLDSILGIPEKPQDKPEAPEGPDEGDDKPEPPETPPEVPEAPEEGDSDKGKKYVYEFVMDIEEADGLVAFPFEGGKVKGRLFITGRESDFSEPRGQKLLVSGVIDSVISSDGSDITGSLYGNTEMEAVEYTLSSYELGYAVDNKNASVSGVGILSENFGIIGDIRINGKGKGDYKRFARNVKCLGIAVLKEVQDVD